MGNSLTLNDINSGDYGVIISGGGTYATPERVITSVEVPSRNGDIQYDEENYKNIIVTYPAGIAKNFKANYLDFIDALKSAPVYSKLTDTYHPEYYRYGTLIDELVPEVGTALRSGKFELPFNCKPQRYLVSGDTPVSFTPTPKTLPTTYLFSDFSSAAQYRIITDLAGAGYSSAEVQAMEFLMCNQTLSEDVTVSIEAESSQPFFALVVNRDPQTLPAWDPTMYMGISYLKTFKTRRTVWGDDIYVLIARVPEAKIFFGDNLVLYYDYFDEHSLTNPTNHKAAPIIRAEVSGTFDDYLFGINDCSLHYNSGADDTTALIHAITLNCESMNCYSLPEDNDLGIRINCNKYIKLSNYSMSLMPGSNDILIGNYCDVLEITPRWWTL